MDQITRRNFVATVGALGLVGNADAQTPRVRPDVRSAAGRVNLRKYADAVGRMSALPGSDPKSWTYQWYIHSVPTDTTKQRELDRLFPAASPGRELAAEVWSTCQAHFPGTNSDYFLPWHRMYLVNFEETVRSVLGDSSFVLPYWNYVDGTQRALPAEFLKDGDSVWGSLFRATRRSDTNSGLPIDADDGDPSPLNAGALGQVTYRPANGRAGFCREIDGNLHGAVHVRVGDGRGMGSVPWAANDPIFWLHHCNIDRLWASWNRNGGLNPMDSWRDKTFVFPDGRGGRVVTPIKAVLAMTDVPYTYEALQPGPTITAAAATVPERPQVTIATARGIALGADGAEVQLTPTSGPRPRVVGASTRRTFVLLSDLQAKTQPGVLYRVEVQDRAGAWRRVGLLNFFDAVPHGGPGEHDHGTAAMSDKLFSYDVTAIAGELEANPAVRIRPNGTPDAEAAPVVGKLDIVEN